MPNQFRIGWVPSKLPSVRPALVAATPAPSYLEYRIGDSHGPVLILHLQNNGIRISQDLNRAVTTTRCAFGDIHALAPFAFFPRDASWFNTREIRRRDRHLRESRGGTVVDPAAMKIARDKDQSTHSVTINKASQA